MEVEAGKRDGEVERVSNGGMVGVIARARKRRAVWMHDNFDWDASSQARLAYAFFGNTKISNNAKITKRKDSLFFFVILGVFAVIASLCFPKTFSRTIAPHSHRTRV